MIKKVMLWFISRRWLWLITIRPGIVIYEHAFLTEVIAYQNYEYHTLDDVIKNTVNKYTSKKLK
jgi:hypothetical protein